MFSCVCGSLKKDVVELNDVMRDMVCPLCGTKLSENVVFRQTSLESFVSLDENVLTGDRKIILDELKKGEGTDRELTKRLGFSDPNKIRPRRKELTDMNLVKPLFKRECSISKKNAIVWGCC